MKIGRGMIFHVACAISLLLAAAMVWLWVKSFPDEFHHLSFVKGDARYTLRSRWGQFVWFGPPMQGEDEKWMAEIAARMNNEDFEWRPISSEYLEGTVRKSSATREMWDANWRLRQYVEPGGRLLDEKLMKARARLFLSAMEDPRKVLPAHLMLLCAAEEKRQNYFQRQQHWREASFVRESADAPEEPVLYMRKDATGKGPDLSGALKLRQEWHDVLDRPRSAIFHGWILLAALVMPLAWLTRPRQIRFTNSRWFFNWVSLVSAMLCTASIAMLVRSRSIDEQWRFAPYPSRETAKWNYEMSTQSWIGSSKGMFICRATDVPEARWVGVKSTGWGYQKTVSPGPSLPANISVPLSGEHKLNLPGFELHTMPAQIITVTTPARVLPIPNAGALGYPPGTTMIIPASTGRTLLGFRVLTIRWWLIIALTSISPAIWLWGAGVRWKRIRLGKKLAAIICLNCGYDMRATPQRCPECGCEPEAKTLKPEAA